MHELPITQSILDIALKEAKKRNVVKVCKIYIKQGEYTDYVPEIVQQYFDLLSEDTVAEGAEIIIEKIPAVLYCEDCKEENKVTHFRMRCPKCNGANTRLVSGKEFYIDNMEVEDGD